PRSASLRTTGSKMRTYQKLRIESRIRSRSGLAITSKPHGDVVAHVAEHAQRSPRRRGNPIHASSNSPPRKRGNRTQHSPDAANGMNQHEAQHAARRLAEALPRLGDAFAREQAVAAAEVPDAKRDRDGEDKHAQRAGTEGFRDRRARMIGCAL